MSSDDITSDFLNGAYSLTNAITDMRDQFSPRLKVCRFNPWVRLPYRISPLSPAWDLFTPSRFHDIVLPGQTKLIPLGLWFSFPQGYYGQLLSRLHISLTFSCFVEDGIIDPSDRGETHVLIHNFGTSPFFVKGDMRICQMVMVRYENTIAEVEEMPEHVYDAMHSL